MFGGTSVPLAIEGANTKLFRYRPVQETVAFRGGVVLPLPRLQLEAQ